jgi:hypothetical protein
MPGVTPFRPDDDVRDARAWAAYVAEDANASAPPSLEARVLRAARAAVVARQRADAETKRHRWFAGVTAIAASLLAASAWWLAPRAIDVPATGAAPHAPASVNADAVSAPMAAADESGDPGRPLPMTNVEAGRVLGSSPPMLAARPLFDGIDGGPVAAPDTLRAKAFGAPTVEPTFAHGRPTHSIPAAGPAPALASAPLVPLGAPVAATAPEAWSSRGFKDVFDPEAGEAPAPAPVRLDQAAPAPPAPPVDPPAPPK